jgi:hypothetical protein
MRFPASCAIESGTGRATLPQNQLGPVRRALGEKNTRKTVQAAASPSQSGGEDSA